MEFDKNNVGKFYISDAYIYVIVGWDYINKQYIMQQLIPNIWFKIYNYNSLENNLIDKLCSYEDIIDNFNEQLNQLQQYFDVIKSFEDKCNNVTAQNTLRRLYETNINIKCLEELVEITNGQDKIFYQRELLKTKKGLRRVYKVMYNKIGQEGINIILQYMQTYNNVSLSYIIYNIKKLEQQIEAINNIHTIKLSTS